MKLEIAIEILDISVKRREMWALNQKDAIKLGIEALKFKRDIRAHIVDDFDALLTGETKE